MTLTKARLRSPAPILAACVVLVLGIGTALYLRDDGHAAPRQATQLEQARSKIKHIVFVILENHSYDSIFGRYPGSAGTTTAKDAVLGTFPMPHAPAFGWHDIDHEYQNAVTGLAGGKMNGFSKIPLQNGFYAEQATGGDPWSNQQITGGGDNYFSFTDGSQGLVDTQTQCTPPASPDEIDMSPTVCGPDGTWWQVDWSGQVTHILASGEVVPYLAVGGAPGSAELVSVSAQRSHCNCVWVVWGDSQARLNASGDVSYQPIPGSAPLHAASGLLQP